MWARGPPFVLGVQTNDERPRDVWRQSVFSQDQGFTEMYGVTGKGVDEVC